MLRQTYLTDDSPLWFPGLAEDLVTDFNSHASVRRNVAADYGSQRWLMARADTPIVKRGSVRIGRHLATVEELPHVTTQSHFADLTFAKGDPSAALENVEAAADILTAIGSLGEAVGRLVRSIHLLEAPLDHDVSHSTPQLPFSVFVSLPKPTEKDTALRVAESLIHEAMHLQLTLIESTQPLVSAPNAVGYSPWKDEMRPVTGLLHGIYVFAVIHEALGSLQRCRPASQPYCTKRRMAIQDEVAVLPEQADGLSMVGHRLWRRCRSRIMSPQSE